MSNFLPRAIRLQIILNLAAVQLFKGLKESFSLLSLSYFFFSEAVLELTLCQTVFKGLLLHPSLSIKNYYQLLSKQIIHLSCGGKLHLFI